MREPSPDQADGHRASSFGALLSRGLDASLDGVHREREWNVPIIVYNIRHLWSKKGIDNCFERNKSPLLLIIITFIFRRGRSEQQSARLRRDYTAVHIFYKYTGPLFRRRLGEDG